MIESLRQQFRRWATAIEWYIWLLKQEAQYA